MADSKSSSQKTRKRATSQSPNGAKSSASKPKAARSRSTKASAGTSRAKQSRPKQSAAKQDSSEQNGGATVAKRAAQVAGTVKDGAAKAKGPAIAVGAAAAGVAGGVLLRGRLRRRTVLGLPLPRALDHRSLSDIDVKSIAKTIGEASQSFAKTSKTVSKDIERAGDQAERIGKILG